MSIINIYANINVGNIPGKLLFCEVVFFLWKANIECWIFLPPLLSSMERLYKHHLLPYMSALVFLYVSIEISWKKDEIT